MPEPIFLGKSPSSLVELLPQMANRHGLIAGATGTGKTVTLRVLAEGFSRMGVPVFLADVKGDLAGLSHQGTLNERISQRITDLGMTDWKPEAFPVVLWDVLGEAGHPIRMTVSEVGPLLLSRLLNLNDIQSGVLNVVFKVADDAGMLLLDLKDLQAMLAYVGENAKQFTLEYGTVSAASIGAIQRSLLALRESGGDRFFGEPALCIEDLLQTDSRGRGVINILSAEKLMLSPAVYSTFLLWLLSELFERLPEEGDVEKPKLVFFFDEAHLLFDEAPKVLRDKIEQVVRLIRSKGVGIYFVSQSPLDIADDVLAQLGNRIQHALRAFTAKDQKALKATADTFRSDGSVDLQAALGELAIGEAIVSLLDTNGTPTIAQRAMIAPPTSRLGAITPSEREEIIKGSTIFGTYEETIDRESAYEILKKRASDATPEQSKIETSAAQSDSPSIFTTIFGGGSASGGKRSRQTPMEAMVVSTARSVGSQLGRQIMRGIFGSLLGGGKRKR
jgi:DNA helicase HerA-like ATPase